MSEITVHSDIFQVVCDFPVWPIRSRDVPVLVVSVSRHFGHEILQKSYINATYFDQRKVLFKHRKSIGSR